MSTTTTSARKRKQDGEDAEEDSIRYKVKGFVRGTGKKKKSSIVHSTRGKTKYEFVLGAYRCPIRDVIKVDTACKLIILRLDSSLGLDDYEEMSYYKGDTSTLRDLAIIKERHILEEDICDDCARHVAHVIGVGGGAEVCYKCSKKYDDE